VKIGKFSFFKRRLQFDILVEFFSLLMVTTVSIMWYTYHNDSKAAVRLSDDFISQISTSTVDMNTSYLAQAQNAAEISSKFILSEADVHLENRPLIDYMITTLKLHPFMYAVYAATEKGDFLEVLRTPEKSFYRTETSKTLPPSVKYSARYIRRSQAPEIDLWQHLDKDGNVQDTERLSVLRYDHRVRSWYLKTRRKQGITWSDIYIFKTLTQPGISVSTALLDENRSFYGAVVVDITMDSVTRFLKKASIGQDGVAFLLDGSGHLVAHPDPSYTMKVSGDDIETVQVSEVSDKRISQAYFRHIDTGEDRFVFDYKDVEYAASFTPFKHYLTDWKMGLVVPTSEFVGEIEHTQKITFVISAVIFLIAALIIGILAKRISRPITEMAEQAESLTRFELEDNHTVKSNIQEIQRLSSALEKMRATLRAFSKFVPSGIVKRLTTQGLDVRLGGRPKTLTIFFSDIANFTTIGEKYPKEKLMTHLSDYFDEMTKIIMELNGTVDKYIGDAVMAFWGAPSADRKHALHACQAALMCQKRLVALNRKWRSEKKPELHTRIGLHTGEVLVGNMGSSDRINYTVLGDSVTLASRLEGTNKMYGTKVIISQEVYELVHKNCLTRPLDIVAVKGKEKGVKIYELVAFKKGVTELLHSKKQLEFCEMFSQGFKVYLEKRWDEAIDTFQKVNRKFGTDGTTNMYIERCKEFKQNPPKANWDGVVHLKTK
jgi:adenylate cyclase